MSTDPIWSRPEPGARKAGHTRDDIARAAIAIADAEGFEAVSMRRIAAELGAGTMTLYHYVRTKDELLALMDDTVMEELVIPAEEMPEGWRDGMTAIARRSLEIFLRHPWIFEAFRGDELGPNVLRHAEQSLEVAARTGIEDPAEQTELMGIIDDYVYGYVLRTASYRKFNEEHEVEAVIDRMEDFLEAQLQTGELPRLQAYVGPDVRAGLRRLSEVDGPARFERGLGMLLDGISLRVEAATAPARRRPSRSRERGRRA